ncbi:hypothetical protein BDZ45DRAFT_460392 [Acephala macrosclerotiorum]|nr:hypothetical protein BDZ45DRAFT_460392 [Acephala macrosclerotiorum]
MPAYRLCIRALKSGFSTMVLLRSRPSSLPSSSSTEYLTPDITRPSSQRSRPSSETIDSAAAERLKLEQEIIGRYDPGGEAPQLWPMSEHRKMVGTMMLDNMLYATARLQKHWWVLGSRNEEFGESESSISRMRRGKGKEWRKKC